jgi:hypothetical protein
MSEAPPFVATTFTEIYERVLVGPLFRPFAEQLLARVALHHGDSLIDVACGLLPPTSAWTESGPLFVRAPCAEAGPEHGARIPFQRLQRALRSSDVSVERVYQLNRAPIRICRGD